MQDRTFGKTGVAVAPVGMGCMRFENPEAIGEMAEVVYHAFDQGVTYFDTAPGYCADKSEDIVGTAVKEMKKTGRPFQIATKCMSDDPQQVRESCERSLERLHVDALDFFHVWCLVRPGDLAHRKARGVLDEFRRLKEEGLVRHVAVSTHLEHGRVERMLDEAEGLFEGMLIGLNAMNYAMRGPGARAAAARGIGVVTMNTLGGGLLTEHADHFKTLMHEGDDAMVDAALRFNLSLPEVTVALVGFRNKADVDSAMRAVARFSPLSEQEIADTHAELLASVEDFCTQCGYCDVCPVDIPVIRLMEAYNHKLLDGPQAMINQLKYHWGIPHPSETLESCTECGQCEEACTQHLSILKRFGDIRQYEKDFAQ